MTPTRSHITGIIATGMIITTSVIAADDAKPAPAAVRAKAVIIKKAVPAAAAAPVEVKAEIVGPAAAKPKAADQPAEVKLATEKPVAPANLKGFGKNEDARKPVKAAPAAEKALPAAAMVQAVPAEQIKQIAEQYKQQLQPVLSGELAFIRLMCDLPMEKRKAVRAAGLAVIDEVATQMAEQQNRGRGINAVRVAAPAATKQQAVNDPPKAIRAALDAALNEALPEDQLKAYREEAGYRKEQRKQAAIRSVVARLDGMLCLTMVARDKITKSITESWQEDYERWLQMHQYGDQYFPTVPDNLVSAHLNAEQRQVWSGLQKVSFGGWGNFGGGVVLGDDGWWGEAVGDPGAGGGGLEIIDAAGF